jgi:transcription elongation factor GreA
MTEYASKETFIKLKKELELLKFQRKEIADRLKRSASYGDLTENSEYQQAREDKEMLETKIAEMEKRIRNVVIKEKSNTKDKIGFYSKIRVKNGEEVLELTLVSPDDSNFTEGKVSYESPLGKVLLDKKKGDKVNVETPGGQKLYEILSIN